MVAPGNGVVSRSISSLPGSLPPLRNPARLPRILLPGRRQSSSPSWDERRTRTKLCYSPRRQQQQQQPEEDGMEALDVARLASMDPTYDHVVRTHICNAENAVVDAISGAILKLERDNDDRDDMLRSSNTSGWQSGGSGGKWSRSESRAKAIQAVVDSMKSVADAIQNTKTIHWSTEVTEAVQELTGYDDRIKKLAVDDLVQNETKSRAFICKKNVLRRSWMDRFERAHPDDS